ncbi:MAG TPA: tetratricopeptide repeat protein [Thermoanaerobaculia bacterium]|nr:tetratricopeptide repeat protein [Thermoanaerobaculia bacterium]
MEEFDVFVSHASEDKTRFVEPLVAALRERGLRVWYDSHEIRLGDDFRRKMDEGLSRSRFGVVVLSPRFFKYWPEAELSALFNQEATFDVTRILPVRCDLDRATLTRRLPLLAGRADIGWEMGVATVADRIRDRVHNTPADTHSARSPVYNLPSRRARELFGRETDLERLDSLLKPGHSMSIEGLAGVGKTELALHMVDRHAATGRFPGGIFWFDAEQPDLTTTWGSVIADALAVSPGTVQERAAGALRIASSGGPVLIVLDNVESWTRANEPRPLPSGPHVAILVTTRRQFLGGRSFEHHTLEVLPADAAREFLISVAGRDLARSPGLDDLLHQLEGHSLAIELAGAYLREFPSVTPAEYLKRLAEGLPVEEKVQDMVRYEATVRRALDVHWAKLDNAAREALLVAACFAPEEASIALLEACGVGDDALQPLRRFHLIVGDGERWRMHRLVREWARRVASTEAYAQAKRNFIEGCAEYSLQIRLEDGFRLYRADGKHLEQAGHEAAAVLGTDDARVSRLFDRLGIALQSMGDLPRAKELLELALASDLKNLGEDHPDVSAARSNLALVLRYLGELPRAKELLELALASDLKNLAENQMAAKRSNLALVLRQLGDLPRAKELLELALASDLETLGEDHPTVATERSNLALVLQDLGDLPRAKELLELALVSNLKSLGENHPTVAAQRFNLARLSWEGRDLAGARAQLSQALATEERSLGANHPSTAFTRAFLAAVLDLLGETESARAEVEHAVRAVANQPTGSYLRTQVERIAARILGRT